MSKYTISEVIDAENLKKTLAEALGVKASVKKRRLLFLVGQTRIHVDQVEGLGNFMELEVVNISQSPEYFEEVFILPFINQ